MAITQFEIIDEENGYHLLKKSSDEYTVVRRKEQRISPPDARSVMPGDKTPDGGVWTADWGDNGIETVASWYSYSWAREIFNRHTANTQPAHRR